MELETLESKVNELVPAAKYHSVIEEASRKPHYLVLLITVQP